MSFLLTSNLYQKAYQMKYIFRTLAFLLFLSGLPGLYSKWYDLKTIYSVTKYVPSQQVVSLPSTWAFPVAAMLLSTRSPFSICRILTLLLQQVLLIRYLYATNLSSVTHMTSGSKSRSSFYNLLFSSGSKFKIRKFGNPTSTATLLLPQIPALKGFLPQLLSQRCYWTITMWGTIQVLFQGVKDLLVSSLSLAFVWGDKLASMQTECRKQNFLMEQQSNWTPCSMKITIGMPNRVMIFYQRNFFTRLVVIFVFGLASIQSVK